jgi:predicted dehydrogenase
MTGSVATPISVAVVGAGYWGRNYVRNLNAMPQARLSWVCDLDQRALARAGRVAPDARLTTELAEVLADDDLQAVVVATNAVHHHGHAVAALKAGKHVLVEKPMASSVQQAEDMVALAGQNGRVLMVGHLMVYHPAVEKLRQIIESGELGQIYYMYALRVNLGRVRSDENALWSFAPHDLSIIRYLLQANPESVWARGECYLQPDVEDVVFVNLQFEDRTMAQIQLSWLDPRKERRLTVVGSKKMVVFDDTHASEKLRIYDKGFERPPEYDTYGDYLSIRNGDIHIPHLALAEPLTLECRHFLECIVSGAEPRTGRQDGLEVVRILAAAEESMRGGGGAVGV